MRPPQAFLFDAYGTLFDVHRVVARSGARIGVGVPERAEVLSQLWRRKQLEYTWLRALMERYEDICRITEAALHAAVRELSIEATDRQLDQLMDAYLHPPVFEDVRPGLQALRDSPLAVLSNGSPTMLDSAVRNSGIESLFAAVISVDRVKTYKPSPRVYALGPEILNLPAAEILFVSSNSWDAAGAKAFGYQVCWCNRSGAKGDDQGFAPDLVVSRLDQVADSYLCSASGRD
jgi:2-haloacid dehalogenase